jgi:hypothetical protein
MNKKGQAGLEFLMTYGWIIVLIIIICMIIGGIFLVKHFTNKPVQPTGKDCVVYFTDSHIIIGGQLTDVRLRDNAKGIVINKTDCCCAGTQPNYVCNCGDVK